MSETFSDADIAAMRQQITELMATIDDFQTMLKPLQEQQDSNKAEKDAAYQAYLQVVAKLDQQDREINSQIRDIQRQANSARLEISRVEQQMEQAFNLAKLEQEMLTLEKRWDALTAGAPWREFAMEHQLSASNKMVTARRMALCDMMGLGKTMSAIIACDKIKAATAEGDNWTEEDAWGHTYDHHDIPAGRHILYLSPAELVRNVQPEWRKWAPHRNNPIILAKTTKMQRRILLEVLQEQKEAGEDFVVQLNYEAWRKDMAFLEDLIALGFDTVILDEAHSLKNRESIAYKGVRMLLDGVNRFGEPIAQPVRFIFPMTGTPFLNRPQELFSILTLVDPKVFRNDRHSENDFLYNYCLQNDDNKWIFRPGGLESLAKKISNRYMRRTFKDAGITLPPQTFTYHDIEQDDENYPRQAKARSDMRDRARLILDADKGYAIAAPIMLTVYLRLRQIETWGDGIELKDGDGNVVCRVDINQSQKLDYVIDPEGNGLLTELCPDHRTVIFSQFTAPLEEIKKRAEKAGLRAVILNGDTPQNIKQEIKIDFDRTRCRENGREPKWDLLLANYRVGGQGLNLTDATQTIALDEEWNPGKGFGDENSEDHGQAGHRTFRIGQTENTGIHILRMVNTIDSWLAGIIEEKKQLTGEFAAAMDKQAFLDALGKGEV